MVKTPQNNLDEFFSVVFLNYFFFKYYKFINIKLHKCIIS
jgi:hypothetical protein